MSRKIKTKEEKVEIFSKRGLAIYFLILLYAITLRTNYDVMHRDFWHDEAFSYEYAQMPTTFILNSTDVHPPLFTFFAKFLIDGLGIDDIIRLRTIMLTLSIVCMWSLYYVVSYIFKDENVGLVSLAIFAVSPTFIFYSTEFRSYILALILVIWQVFFYHKISLKDEENTTIASFLYILFSVLMVGTHYLTGLIIIVQVLYSTIKKRCWHYMEYVMVSILSLPFIIYAIRTFPKIQSFWFKDIDFVSFISTFNYIFAPPMKLTGVWTLFIVFGLGMALFSKFEFGKRGRLMLFYAIVPVIIMWCISQFFPFYHHRYFIFGGVFLFVAIAHGFIIMDKVYEDYHHVAYALCILFMIIGIPSFHSILNHELADGSDAISIDAQNVSFAVIHESPFSQTPMKVYLPEGRHILVTNLTEDMLFTAGGSVITDHCYDISCAYKIADNYDKIYYVSDRYQERKEIIFNEGGLWIQKLN